MILCASAIHLFGSHKNFNLKMFKSLGLLKPKLIKLLIDLANRPGTLWTSAVLNWWLVLVGKEPAAFTVSLAKSGGARMEATEVMEAASLSRVGLQYTCSGLCLVCVIKKTLSFFCLLTADRFVKSLAQVFPVYKGEDGQSGGSKNCYGRNGSTTYVHVSPCVESMRFMSRFNLNLLYFAPLKVPLGTVVKEQGRTVTDFSQHGQEFMAAFGGAGGKGNQFFLTNENRAPMTSTQGAQGQERLLHLELRTMAHAGLVRQCCS